MASSSSQASEPPKHSAILTSVKIAVLCGVAVALFALVTSLKATKSQMDQGMRPAELTWSHGTSDRQLQRAIQMNDGEFVAQVLNRTPREKISDNIVERLAFDLSANALDAFLWKGWDPNGVNGSGAPLIEAAKSGQLAAMKVLFRHGAKARVRDDQGRSPLFVASISLHSNPKVIELLASKGVPCDEPATIHLDGVPAAQSKETKLRPIAAACLSGNLDSVKTLLKLHAKAAAVGSEELPPLIAAAIGPNPTPISRALVEAGADPRQTGVAAIQKGKSWRSVRANALYFNAALDHYEAVALLRSKGVDPHLKSSDGSTALDVATGRSADILRNGPRR